MLLKLKEEIGTNKAFLQGHSNSMILWAVEKRGGHLDRIHVELNFHFWENFESGVALF